jgi:hypothetical protein
MKACVNGWEPDESAVGDHKLVPVTCRDTIKGLEKLVKALSYMVRRDTHLPALSTDSAVIAAAKKLLEPDADRPNTICREFFLVPSIKFRKDGSPIHTDITVFCAEPLAHAGPCISKEGYVRWSYSAKGESNDSARSQA